MPHRTQTSFHIKHTSEQGGRRGEIHFGAKGVIQTPALFPTLYVMTGPPGFGRQGAHYKYIKRQMVREWRFNHFLTEILHFSDYMGTKESLDDWLAKPFQDWAEELMLGEGTQDKPKPGEHDFEGYGIPVDPYDICFFLDSGGYRLLTNSDFSVEKFGLKTSPQDILKLQTQMGADIIASLDYPLAPVEYQRAALVELQNSSLENALYVLRQVSSRPRDEPQPLVFLAVHGVDYESAYEYMDRLLRRIDRMQKKSAQFGFAVGSLVPRRSNRALVVSIVKGVKDAIANHRHGLYEDKPIHCFGIGGDLVPTLAFLGVDTFDSNSFVQGGKNLRFVMPSSDTTSKAREARLIHEITERDLATCGCRACTKYRGLLEDLKDLTRRDRDGHHQMKAAGRKMIKSEVYAFLAMHNLEMELQELGTVRDEISSDRLDSYLFEYAGRTNLTGKLYAAYEAATGKKVERLKHRKVSLSLTRDSFAIPESYSPEANKEVLLLLPCTREKPYKVSRAHQAIRTALHNDSRIHVVTVSGLYGPVPEEFETENEILHYDYVLSPEARDQMKVVEERLAAYLARFGNHYRQIIGYATTRAYRDVVRRALKSYGRGHLLPAKPRERTSKEFLKHVNVAELQQAVLGSAIHP